jgi:hypothetical protein
VRSLSRIVVLLGAYLMALAISGCQGFTVRDEPPVTWVPLPTVASTATAEAAVPTPAQLIVDEQPPTATASVTATPAPPTTEPIEMVQGWKGTLHSLPDGGKTDIAFRLQDQPGKESAITASSAALQSRLESVVDSPTVVQVWGVLRKSATEHGGSLIVVDRVEAAEIQPDVGTPTATPPPTDLPATPSPEPPAPIAAPPLAGPASTPTLIMATATELVDGWVGVIQGLPPGTSYTDYFERSDTSAQYGISSLVPRIEEDLAAYRDTGRAVRIWGVVDFGVIDHMGRRIVVTRVEPVEP